VADLPVPGEELIGERSEPRIHDDARLQDSKALEASVPPAVLTILRTLWSAGHAAYVVGGSIRDVLLGRAVDDWDVATSARPD
jgi:hypothetical protein